VSEKSWKKISADFNFDHNDVEIAKAIDRSKPTSHGIGRHLNASLCR
jgi:hypothetical protein